MTEETYKPPAVKGGIALAILLSLLTSHSNGQQQPVMDGSASFFFCEHQETNKPDFSATPSAAVQLVGNPKNYQDGAIYNGLFKYNCKVGV